MSLLPTISTSSRTLSIPHVIITPSTPLLPSPRTCHRRSSSYARKPLPTAQSLIEALELDSSKYLSPQSTRSTPPSAPSSRSPVIAVLIMLVVFVLMISSIVKLDDLSAVSIARTPASPFGHIGQPEPDLHVYVHGGLRQRSEKLGQGERDWARWMRERAEASEHAVQAGPTTRMDAWDFHG